ncbi:MAG: response regulator [Anaerolineae bacterium]|nr:response regulator [Anaerolineae bacterium]
MDPQYRPNVLIVDDKPDNLYALEKLLRELNVEVFQATSGFDALALTLEHDFCVAIVDVQMPEMDGYELVTLLRGNESTASLPIIFVSAIYSDEYHHRKGYSAGAVDFLSKPFVPEILLSKVRVFIDLYSQRLRLQELVDQLNQANAVLSRRAMQLEASYQVGHQATRFLDLDVLMKQAVELIRARFDYSTVGIWMHDDASGALVLRAFNCKDFARHASLGATIPTCAEKGIVAHVFRTATAYLSADVTIDEIYLRIQHNTDTRSELALPLQTRRGLLGVLDIQSDRVAAFDPEDQKVLQTMADQIAIAVRNAQLYAEVVHFNEALEEKVQERTAELEKAYRHLEMLDRNKSDFIQIVSHELRTPLTLIKGFSQMLLRDSHVQEDGACRQQAQGIVSGVERMHDVVNSMLDIVRIDNRVLDLVFERVSIPYVMTRLHAELYQPLLERNLTLIVGDMSTLPEVEGDVDALCKLFGNLLTNAIKYTPDGGAVTVTGRVLGMPGESQERFVEVVVSDTGIGIDVDAQELIFTKFYQTGRVAFHSSGRTKFKGGGPGLGLAIARGIVEAHRGRIWAESPGYDEEACPGSAFHVVLPEVQGAVSPEQIQQRLIGLSEQRP